MGERIDESEQPTTAAAPAAGGSIQNRILQVFRDGQASAEETARLQKRIVDALGRLGAK